MTDKWCMRFWQLFAIVFLALVGFIGGAVWRGAPPVLVGGSCPTIQSYFSPKGATDTAILDLIKRSKKTIKVAIYSFNNKDIYEALKMAEKRGVDVSVVQDKLQAAGKYSLVYPKAKIMSGINGGVMHNKYAIFDGDCVIISSYNWTIAAELRNFENSVVICEDSNLTSQYEKDFRKLYWK